MSHSAQRLDGLSINVTSFDVAVVGTGPAGLASALALAGLGLRVVAVGAAPSSRDTRTAALFAGSITLLENLGVGDVCRNDGEPITGIRIIDDMGGAAARPEVTFTAAEAGLERFGYNVANAASSRRCAPAPQGTGHLTLMDANVGEVVVDDTRAEVHLADGRTLAAKLVVGADGRQSLCRQAAQIPVKTGLRAKCPGLHFRAPAAA